MLVITSDPVNAWFWEDIQKQAKSLDVEVLSLLESEAIASIGSIVAHSEELSQNLRIRS